MAMSAFLPSGHHHAHSLSHRTASWSNRTGAQFTALRYLALDGTGPPQPQRTRQHEPPAHHLANNHAGDERLRQTVTGQTLPDAALAAWSGCQSAGSRARPDRAEQKRIFVVPGRANTHTNPLDRGLLDMG